jgi:penicillin V acylase-like amidase (Ntn superfamily)
MYPNGRIDTQKYIEFCIRTCLLLSINKQKEELENIIVNNNQTFNKYIIPKNIMKREQNIYKYNICREIAHCCCHEKVLYLFEYFGLLFWKDLFS